MFALRGTIFLIELTFYCPIVPFIILIILIHGSRKPYTWHPVTIPLLLLTGLRISGAALGFAGWNTANSTLLITASLLDIIGLASESCLFIGLLSKANAPLRKAPWGLPVWIFIPLQILTIAATIMTAYGSPDIYPSIRSNQSELMRVGMYLLILVYLSTAGLACVMLSTLLTDFNMKCYRTERAATICAYLLVPARLGFSIGSLLAGEETPPNPVSDNDTDIWLHFFTVVVLQYAAALSATVIALSFRKVTPIAAGKDDLLSKEDI